MPKYKVTTAEDHILLACNLDFIETNNNNKNNAWKDVAEIVECT